MSTPTSGSRWTDCERYGQRTARLAVMMFHAAGWSLRDSEHPSVPASVLSCHDRVCHAAALVRPGDHLSKWIAGKRRKHRAVGQWRAGRVEPTSIVTKFGQLVSGCPGPDVPAAPSPAATKLRSSLALPNCMYSGVISNLKVSSEPGTLSESTSYVRPHEPGPTGTYSVESVNGVPLRKV